MAAATPAGPPPTTSTSRLGEDRDVARRLVDRLRGTAAPGRPRAVAEDLEALETEEPLPAACRHASPCAGPLPGPVLCPEV